MSFPRYPKYKDSGVEWLGEVPGHWEVRRLRQIGPLLKGCGGSKEDVVETGVPCVRYGDLYTTHAYMIRQARTCVTEERAADYFPVQRGDVLFAASGEDLAEIGRSAVVLFDERACCGGDLVVLRPEVAVVPEFMGYACDCWVAKAQKASMGRGTTVKHIYPDELKMLVLAAPPPPEQTAIAAFLDRETAKIGALIAEQQRLIELLQEKRQAAISHAVTKGLIPDAPMKNSGIEWLGEAPEHWGCGPLKHFWNVIDCKHVTVPFLDEGYPVASVMEVRQFDLDLSQVQRTSEEYFRLLTDGGRQPRQGDVIYCRNTANTGTSAYVDTTEPLAIGQDVVLITSPTQNGRFLNYILHSGMMAAQLATLLVGSTFKRINVAQIRSLSVTCPPRMEQDAVVAFLDRHSAAYELLAADASKAISLLQERRSALISAAVTGQIDVRGLASSEAA